MSLSACDELVACLLETESGKEIVIRHINSMKELRLEKFAGEVSSLEFGRQKDLRHSLFYVTNDSVGRPQAVWGLAFVWKEESETFIIKEPPSLVKQFADPSVMVTIQRTKGCKYLSIQAATKTENEIYLCGEVSEPLLLVMKRQKGLNYHLDVGTDNDVFLLVSYNASAAQNCLLERRKDLGLDYSLWKASLNDLPLDATSDKFGQLVSSSDRGFAITDMELFKDAICLYESSLSDGERRIRVIQRDEIAQHSEAKRKSGKTIMIEQPEVCGLLTPTGNLNYAASCIRYVVESPACPPKVLEYDWRSCETKTLSKETFSKAGAVHRKLLVTSADKSSVPLSLVYREAPSNQSGLKHVVLFGYGSYGESMDLGYSPAFQPLLDRGFVLAYAHTRGGGDLGRGWYEGGRLYNKQRAVEDFVACARALCEPSARLSEPSKITARAFSAGGVIVGAAVNENPELFQGAVVLTHAFLDVKRTMENKNLYLTEHEFDEYGDPTADPRAARAISSYCPVLNADSCDEQRARFLITGSFNDKQVPFWNSLIYGKKIRKRSRVKSRVNIHIGEGGHHMDLHLSALEAAFIVGNRPAYYGLSME